MLLEFVRRSMRFSSLYTVVQQNHSLKECIYIRFYISLQKRSGFKYLLVTSLIRKSFEQRALQWCTLNAYLWVHPFKNSSHTPNDAEYSRHNSLSLLVCLSGPHIIFLLKNDHKICCQMKCFPIFLHVKSPSSSQF